MYPTNLEIRQARYAQYAAAMQQHAATKRLLDQAPTAQTPPNRLIILLKNQTPRIKQQFYMGAALEQ